ncbi:hypothetical protein AB3331_11295 [Streptococcus sp. H49]|uniref:hypothetical protein n=1 Tax=Streptococcus huangxiaojuni TaxID=3237239 RepID=UPI0034A2C35B
MKNKRKYFVCLGIVAVCVIGGLILFNSLKSKEEKYRAEQDRVAKYLVEHYELADGHSIEKIEFTDFQKIELAGFWTITAKVNGKYYISFKEDKIGEEIRTSNYSPNEFKLQGNTGGNKYLSDIKVIYYDKEFIW